MKKDIKLKITTFICAALLVLSGCKDESYPDGPVFKEDEGGFSMKELAFEIKNNMSPNISSSSRSEDVDCSEFEIKIVNPTTGKPISDKMVWKYKNIPEILTLAVGKYRIEVESCDWSEKYAEWELPHYVGSYDFEIKAGQITKADKVPCELKNVKVTVEYDEDLKKILDDEAKTTVVAGNQQTADGFQVKLEYGRDETRAGYFRSVEGSRTLVATLRYTYNGVTNDKFHTLNNVTAGQHYLIKYLYIPSDPTLPDKTGSASRGEIKIDAKVITVEVDGTVSIKEVVLDPSDRPGKEDPLTPDDPGTPVTGGIEIINPKKDYFDLDKVNEVKDGETTGREYKLTINSDNGFSSLNVLIKSHDKGLTPEVLSSVGLSSEFDLATGLSKEGADLSESLSGLGFPVKEEVTGDNVKKIDFNITQFVPLLCIYPGDHSFELTVKDKTGAEKKLELKFKAL